MELPDTGHDPVLLDEVMDYLQPPGDGVIVDCTIGRGGHAKKWINFLSDKGLFIGLDADPRNLEFAQEHLGRPSNARLFHANFSDLPDVLHQAKIESVDRIFADLGISTNQLFDDAYGMSFSKSMPLDMRIDPRHPTSAADIVNHWNAEPLADLLFGLAQERHSRRIARKIVEARRQSPILTTQRLADVVRSAVPKRGYEKIDPATRTFMALRMAVNQELDNLATLLKIAPIKLKSGGRLGIISFHSGEDRMVKQKFRELESDGRYTVLTKKPVEPTEIEVEKNPRTRSAKLRVIEKT
jgi:16S rRNA (cytosine1402-N4)-methyltransferase